MKNHKDKNKNNYFPVFICMAERNILVYGGGKIALRRVQGLLNFGARIQLRAPEICPELLELKEKYPGQLQCEKRSYRPGEISELLQMSRKTESGMAKTDAKIDFVLSAIRDPKADRQIWQECKAFGIPVNIASDQSLCDFQFPALVCQEDLVIGVNSGGKDHAKVRCISAKLRSWIKEQGGRDENNTNRKP